MQEDSKKEALPAMEPASVAEIAAEWMYVSPRLWSVVLRTPVGVTRASLVDTSPSRKLVEAPKTAES